MKPLFFLLFVPFCSNAQISTKVLTPGNPAPISISPNLTTTLLFPGPVSGTFGLGLVSGQNSSAGTVQIEHPEGSNVIVLHALTPDAHVIATVLLDGQLYVLDCCVWASSNPDVAVTFISGHAQDAPRAVEVTPQEIKDARPKYDTESLLGLLRRGRDSAFLRNIYPDAYVGYKSKDTSFSSDSGTLKTVVTTVHRFSKEDAVVLQGTVENETDRPITFDGRSAIIQVANEMHPVKLLDCLRPIPPHKMTLIDCVIQGDVDGGRANLSISNEFRIILPTENSVWNFKNGKPATKFDVPKPVKQEIPLTQTGRPVRDAQ